jgi:N-acetylmuramoyl-L-alanine amidase
MSGKRRIKRMIIKQDLLTINEYSRPGSKLFKVKGIVIHWVQNPNTTAKQNRDFFELRKNGDKGYGSAHYIINLDGEIIQCIPDLEMAYHVGAKEYNDIIDKKLSNYPNNCTIGIECCHIDMAGNMTDLTVLALKELIISLCQKYKLSPLHDLFRHYDITGKFCHKYYVNNADKWIDLLEYCEDELLKLRLEQKNGKRST